MSEENKEKEKNNELYDKNDFLSSEFEEIKGKEFNPSDYLTKSLLNRINFSEIILVQNKITKKLYSLKSFEKKIVGQLHKERDVLMEKYIMEKIPKSPYITEYYGAFQDKYLIYLLYEYIGGGDLWKKGVIYGLKCEKLIKFYFIQIIKAIQHLHSFEIVHRDIKPENVLITEDGKIAKLIDFGSSLDSNGTLFEKKMAEDKNKKQLFKQDFSNFVGTPNYMAPECIHNKKPDKSCDVWSLGCLLYFLYTGFPPFLGASEYVIFQKADQAKYIFPEGVVPSLAQDLIQKCIVIDKDKRINIDDILKHPYLKNEADDNSFLENVPQMNDEEIKYSDVVENLKNEFCKFKEISENLEIIKKYEKLEENSEPVENIEKIKELISKKEEFKKQSEEALIELSKKIKEKKILNENNEDFNKKLDFLEIQLKHDLFKKTYYGVEILPLNDKDNESDSESNSSSSHEGKEEDKK